MLLWANNPFEQDSCAPEIIVRRQLLPSKQALITGEGATTLRSVAELIRMAEQRHSAVCCPLNPHRRSSGIGALFIAEPISAWTSAPPTRLVQAAPLGAGFLLAFAHIHVSSHCSFRFLVVVRIISYIGFSFTWAGQREVLKQ